MEKALVAVVMGSKSDFDVVKPCLKALDKFGICYTARVISAHRTPIEAHEFVVAAEKAGVEVIIGVAGKAAHLAGVLAAFTTMPVIALPVQTSLMGGLDSLLSMVQMPSGIPVATVAVNGGENAGVLAAQILSVGHSEIKAKLATYKADMRAKIISDDAALQEELKNL